MNELTFFIHSIVILAFLFTSLRLGKEALCSFVCICWILANFFVTKQVMLFCWEVTPCDVYVIGAMLGLACLQEFWGPELAKRTVRISFILLALASVASYLQLLYIAGPHDTMHEHFEKILTPAPRLTIVSFICFLISQNLDIALFQFLKKMNKLPFSVRAFCSTTVSQFVDTLLFSFLGLWGIVYSVFDIFIVSYSIKLIIVALSSPFLTMCGYFLPKEYYQKS